MSQSASLSLVNRLGLGGLALILATFSLACTLLPPLLRSSAPVSDRAEDALREGARVVLERLAGPPEDEPPGLYLRFDGAHLWRSLAILSSLAAIVVGGIAAFRTAEGRLEAICVMVQSVLIFFWHLFLT